MVGWSPQTDGPRLSVLRRQLALREVEGGAPGELAELRAEFDRLNASHQEFLGAEGARRKAERDQEEAKQRQAWLEELAAIKQEIARLRSGYDGDPVKRARFDKAAETCLGAASVAAKSGDKRDCTVARRSWERFRGSWAVPRTAPPPKPLRIPAAAEATDSPRPRRQSARSLPVGKILRHWFNAGRLGEIQHSSTSVFLSLLLQCRAYRMPTGQWVWRFRGTRSGLGRRCRTADRTVTGALDELEEAGMLSRSAHRERKGGGWRGYIEVIPARPDLEAKQKGRRRSGAVRQSV